MTGSKQKIVLMLLPFWDPQIPPAGIAVLKSFLRRRGYNVTTADANVDQRFRDTYYSYFDALKSFIPEPRRRHLYNIGHDVLKNHFMAHQHHNDANAYAELVRIIIYKTFFHNVSHQQVLQLNGVVEQYYRHLRDYITAILNKEKPDVLGLSIFGGSLPSSLFTFKLAKSLYPNIMNVMGGGIFSGELALDSPNFKRFMEKTPYIDHIIVGEGESLFLNLLEGKLPASRKVFTLNHLDNGLLDIEKADTPDFSGFDLDYYPQMATYTSRSCPFQCSFCVETTYWGKYRKKSGKKIADELTQMFNEHRCQSFFMCDSLLNPILNDLSDELIRRDASIYWGGYLRVDHNVSNPEKTMHWRRGGFYRARLGVESGSQNILDKMGKKISINQIRSSISSLAFAGIKTTTYWVIGHPGESDADFNMTLELIKELKDDIYEADCNPFFYFLTGQVDSEKWQEMNKSVLLYPEEASDMLLLQTWILDCEPSREEVYDRVNRFIQFCKEQGVPNPYSLHDTHMADKRWQKLHKHAVPPLVDLQNKQVFIEENKSVKQVSVASKGLEDNDDWL